MKFATLAALLFAGCLGAQTTESTRTTTTTTSSVNLTGTLVDQGCYTTHTKRTETSSNPDSSTTTTTETTKISTDCPATASTTSFGMVTPEGKYIRFDDAGNTRVVEMMKSNKDWKNYMDERKPVKVHVIGSPNGDYIVVREIR